MRTAGNDIDTTVIVPAYNEAEGLPIVLEALDSLQQPGVEVIVVDDGSSDGTAEVARQYPCRVLSHPTNMGKGAAMRTGIAAARGGKIVFVDADGTYPVESIVPMAAALDSYDVVIGVRSLGQRNTPITNRLGNALIRSILRLLYGTPSRDPLTGLYGLRKPHLDRMGLASSGFAIETEIAIKAARMELSHKNLAIAYSARIGKTKLNPLRDGLRILRLILSYAPMYSPTAVFTVPGAAAIALGCSVLAFSGASGGIAFGSLGGPISSVLVLAGIQIVTLGTLADARTAAALHAPLKPLGRLLRRRFVLLVLGCAGIGSLALGALRL